jgi:hypothetical protein
MNNVLLEMKLFRKHTDTRFLGIEARLDRQAGLLEAQLARLESRP